MDITRGNGKDILLQAFHWNLVKSQGDGTIDAEDLSWYEILNSMVKDISKLGFTIVYLPPPWVDDSRWESNGKHGGGEGYFWRDFDLDSRYGSKKHLTKLISSLHKKDIKVIIDLVTNHRDGERMQKDIWEYPGECWSKGGVDTGGTFMDGSYDLNLANPRVHNRFKDAMNELMDECGVDGWRWDYVWGYAVEDVKTWIRQTEKEEYFSVGEYWQSSPNLTNDPMIQKYGADEGKRILGWAHDSGSCAFDILLKRQINSGNPANLKYGLNSSPNKKDREAVVTFVDNHDMGASPYSPANGWGQQCWPCPPYFKSMAYCFILMMPGTPCVYWPDCFDFGHRDEIGELIKLRKKAGIVSASEWIDLTDKYSGFAAIVKNEEGKEKIALSIGSDYKGPGKGWKLSLEKEGQYSIWLKNKE